MVDASEYSAALLAEELDQLIERAAPLVPAGLLVECQYQRLATIDEPVANRYEPSLDDRCGAMLELLWCRLNTGHWSDVPEDWRRLYTLTMLTRLVRKLRELQNNTYVGNREEYIRVRDALACALLIFLLRQECLSRADQALLLGAPILNNIMSQLADMLHDQLPSPEILTDEIVDQAPKAKQLRMTSAFPQASGGRVVQRIEQPSLAEFAKIIERDEPVLLTDCIEHWPARNRWSVQQVWRDCAWRTVPVEVGRGVYTDRDWSQQLMNVDSFCRRFMTQT